MNKLQQAKFDFIVDEATKLFFKKPIPEVTMSDIAKDIGIGEASLYRYFKKKSNIVVKAAEKLSIKVIEKYFSLDESLSGIDMIRSFYLSFLKVFKENKDYYSFIYYFDAYILQEQPELESYSENVNAFKKVFDVAIEKGKKDNTISYNGDIDIFYRSTTISLLSLCKKLAIQDHILKEDAIYEASKEIETLIDIYIYRLK